MAIAQYTPTAKIHSRIKPNEVLPPDYKTTLVSDTEVNTLSLLAYIDGSPWEVNYYSQILGHNDAVKDHDTEQDMTYQTYLRIKGFNLTVDSPLTHSSDQQTGANTVTGTALVRPFITPNVGDVIEADAGTTRHGLYRVVSVEAKSFNRASVYAIEFQLVEYVELDPSRFNDLVSKVTRDYHYHEERALEGASPLVMTDQHNDLQLVTDGYYSIVKEYFRKFFNPISSTLTLPNQQYLIYDYWLTNFIMTVVEVFDAPEIKKVKRLTMDGDSFMSLPTVWLALEERNPSLLQHAVRQMGLVSKRSFNQNGMIEGLRFQRLDFLLYPSNYPIDYKTPKGEWYVNIDIDTQQKGHIEDALREVHITERSTVPLTMKTLTIKNQYLFSTNFYEQRGIGIVIEELMMQYLTKQPINVKKLVSLLVRYSHWSDLKQFYYGPILLLLTKVVMRGV